MPLKFALISANGLGDGLIQTTLVQNLITLGHQADCYHDLIYDLRPIFKRFDVKKAKSLSEERLQHYDWILVDKGFNGIESLLESSQIRERLLLYSISKTRPDSKFINPAVELVSDAATRKLLTIFNGSCIRRKSSTGEIADQIVHIFKNELGSPEASKVIDLCIPDDWQQNKFPSQTVMHPTSSSQNKNWKPSGFISLANRLSSNGFEPVFTVAPYEQQEWHRLLDGQYSCLNYPSLLDLARVYYESGAFIGNDSGCGHLASLLGLPTLSIFSRHRKHYPWRPCWSEGKIIRPYIPRRLVGKKMWKHFLTEKMVYRQFLMLKS